MNNNFIEDMNSYGYMHSDNTNDYHKLINYPTDKITIMFTNNNNIKIIADKILKLPHNHQNKKEFYRKLSELMNKWIEQVPRDIVFGEDKQLLLPIYDVNFLNALFLDEHKEDILNWTYYNNETTPRIPNPNETEKVMQNILWYNNDVSYGNDVSLNILTSQLHPRHVSQRMLWTRNHDMEREEPIFDSHFESKGNQIRGYKMDNLGYNNTGFGYYSKWH